MKSTGITRQLDSAGRIVLPKELRSMLNLRPNKDYIEIFTQNDCIILRKYSPACVFCDSVEDVIDFNGKKVCRTCAKALSNKAAEL